MAPVHLWKNNHIVHLLHLLHCHLTDSQIVVIALLKLYLVPVSIVQAVLSQSADPPHQLNQGPYNPYLWLSLTVRSCATHNMQERYFPPFLVLIGLCVLAQQICSPKSQTHSRQYALLGKVCNWKCVCPGPSFSKGMASWCKISVEMHHPQQSRSVPQYISQVAVVQRVC